MNNLDYVFERVITINNNGKLIMGTLSIGGVNNIAERNRWACYCSIPVINPERISIYGEDPLDAFSKCLVFVDGLIKGSEADGLEIWWQYKGDHCAILRPIAD